MNRRDAAFRFGLILALAAGLAGCQDSGVNTIKADRKAVEQLQRTISDRPAPPSKSKSGRKSPGTNDLSPKLRGGQTQP